MNNENFGLATFMTGSIRPMIIYGHSILFISGEKGCQDIFHGINMIFFMINVRDFRLRDIMINIFQLIFESMRC